VDDPLKIFISSVMNRTVEDLSAERKAARQAVDSFAPVTCAWAFENEPASSKRVRDAYIDEVKACDLVVLILGRVLTPATQDEFDTAQDYDRPVLVFCKDLPARNPNTDALLATLDAKYDCFSDAADLGTRVRNAVGQEIRRLSKHGDTEAARRGDRMAQLRQFKKNVVEARLTPLIPARKHDLFTVVDIQPATVTLEKSSSDRRVHVPAERIESVMNYGPSEAPVVVLNGRLQWLTLPGAWRFFHEKPPADDPLRIGLPKQSGAGPSFDEVLSQIQRTGCSASWANTDLLPGKLNSGAEVFYDANGFYLSRERQVLIIRRR
jgi:hypothetical protein